MTTAAAGRPVLEAVGITVRYGALRAVSDVSWQVGRNEILGIIGPNGAGKTSCFAGVTNAVAREGDVRFHGRIISSLPMHTLSRLGLRRTYQHNAFFDEMPILENAVAALAREHIVGLGVSLFMPNREASARRVARRAAAELLTRFGVASGFHDIRPREAPYGVQRLLSVALAYGAGCDAMLLDEPAAGAGDSDVARLASLMRELSDDGLALVCIEHHMDLIMEVADQIVVLDHGAMLATGTPPEIQRDQRVLEAYLGARR